MTIMAGSTTDTKAHDLGVVYLVYILSTIVGFQSGLYYEKYNETPYLSQYSIPSTKVLEASLVADIMATVVIFVFSIVYDNSSMYDAYWSVAPQLLTCYWVAEQGFPQLTSNNGGAYVRKWVVMSIMFLWSSRLTYNWARSWTGFDHEDWRYVEVFQKGSKNKAQYWVESFAGIHMFPTLLVFVALLPCYYVLHDVGQEASNNLSLYDAAGAAVGFGAVLIQGIADNQLYYFRQTNKVKGRVLSTGMWALCRHPNYAGEILHW